MAAGRKKQERRGKGRPTASASGVGREALVSAARSLLQELPPAQVTSTAVAKRANADPALVRYYFGNRENLLFEVANRLSGITGGTDGLQGVVIAPVLGLFDFDLYGKTAFGYAFGVVLAMFLLVRLVLRSPFGLALRGIHDSRKRMLAIGSPVAGVTPSIDDEAPLFGKTEDGHGLGLDSLDALQLAMSVEERFGVRIPEGDEARPIFRSVSALAAHVAAARAQTGA